MEQEIAKLKEEGKEIFAKMEVAYEKKDWLNFDLLADQLRLIKEDIQKLEASKNNELER